MYLLLTDETNKEPNDVVKFFIYGGLFIPADKASELHTGIAAIRAKYGYKDTDTLKFDTNKRPSHITQQSVTAAKIDIIKLCHATSCKFSAFIIHHNIAKKEEPRKKYIWAANSIIGRFNIFLKEVNDYGICLADSLPVEGPNQFLADTFTSGLTIDGNNKKIKLSRILLMGITCINASHLVSAIDIVLGTFRYCLNSSSTDGKIKDMLCSVVRMMWYKENDGTKYIRERGLLVRPKTITVQSYKQEYESMIARIQQLIDNVDD